jgi:hypothetical protein
VPPSETNSPMTMAAAAQGPAMTIIAGWQPSASAWAMLRLTARRRLT